MKVDSGLIEGIPAPTGSSVQMFRGIPFARPPIGDLRWREPQPVRSWDGIRPADQFGPRCMQKHMWDDMFFRSPSASEDCLYLNVWTPAELRAASSAKLPVLVYIYGGGFIAGDASEPRYDGAAMASHGMVVVTLNYRLGIFGFFAHPQLSGESGHHASGNYGLLDQAAALAWVRRNIAQFGGDPKRITIGGESAGSMSVSALMVSPLSRKNIAGAIGESGSVMMSAKTPTLAEGEAAGMSYAESLQVPTLAQLRAIPADKLLEVQSYGGARFGPLVDGYFLPEPAAVTYASGKAAKIPLLVGSNSQEGAADAILNNAAPTVANYRASLARLYGDKADAVFALYPAASDGDVVRVATDLSSDRFLGAATWRWFDAHRRSGAPTFYYYYQHVRPTAYSATGPAPYGAVHSAEIEYALGNLDANPAYAWTDGDRRVSATMNGYFVNFVKTGDPNGAGLPLWARASTDDKAIQRQTIDVESRRALFNDQARYVAMDALEPPR
ncbi:carboxylesterase/lipase family protein [Sphingomonas crusticola]|uniref:carboxylesterase/lipase family protein n=1 Tax=Sphingomonas crusticola TaxID=1697973 RepID=UPI001967D36B|nr:carboxylesterase family protein [Sphingomonas crusticola]